MKSVFVLTAFVYLLSPFCYGQSRGRGEQGAISKTQSKRSSERFNIIDWIRKNNETRSAQDARYGRGGSAGGGPEPDLTLLYRSDRAKVTRDGVDLGHDTRGTAKIQFLLDNLFTEGSKGRSFNIDLGVEGFASRTSQFSSESSVVQESHAYSETGGGLLIRPIGRSSQDTGLMLKGGYMDVTQTGFWSNSLRSVSMSGIYVGSEVKLYLMPFLGGIADYTTVLETNNDALGGKWKMYRFLYGGFLEIYLINLQFYIFNSEFVLTPSSGASSQKELSVGTGFSAALHF